jgi:hypothetical protein
MQAPPGTGKEQQQADQDDYGSVNSYGCNAFSHVSPEEVGYYHQQQTQRRGNHTGQNRQCCSDIEGWPQAVGSRQSPCNGRQACDDKRYEL